VLERSVGFDGYCVNAVDPATLLVTSSVGDGLDTARAQRLFELEARPSEPNTLRALARGPAFVASLSEATGGRVERSARIRELFAPLGYADELRAALRVDGRCWGFLHLFRGRGGRFDERMVAGVARLTRLLAAALRAGTLRALTRGAPAFEPAFVAFAPRGSSVRTDETARLAAELDDVASSAVPHAVHDVACRLRAEGHARATGVGRDGGARGFRGARLGTRTLVSVDRAAPDACEELLFAAGALTPRELEVARCLARGASNEDVARALSIRLFTAKDHVRAVFRKLGVSQRVELLVRLRAAT